MAPERVVHVEGESRTIGRLRIPEALLQRLRAAPCVQVQMPLAERVAFLLEDYEHFVHDVDAFCERLAALREVRGAAVVERWQAAARGGQLATVVEELLAQHYDPTYERSMARNFAAFGAAPTIKLADAAPATLAAAAAALATGAAS
jgi:tRNA 2-selenouridine synthase